MAFVIKTCWSKLLNYVFMLHISCHAWSSFLSVNGSVHILVASWACSALQISWYLQDWSSATSCNDHFLGFVFTLIVIYRMFKGRHLTICICGHEFFWEWFHRHTPVQISLTGSVLLILYRICFVMYQNGELIRGLSKRHLQALGRIRALDVLGDVILQHEVENYIWRASRLPANVLQVVLWTTMGEKLEVMEEREMLVFHVVVGSDVGLRTVII